MKFCFGILLLHGSHRSYPSRRRFFFSRYELERFSVDISPVVSLGAEEQEKPLGPAYKAGEYELEIAGRKPNCQFNSKTKNVLSNKLSELKKMLRSAEFEDYGKKANYYHGAGHNEIARECMDTDRDWTPVMFVSRMSARDPIFYRWHSHLEDLMQDFRDKRSQK